AVREVREPGLGGAEGVRDTRGGRARDDVSGAHRRLLVPEQQHTLPFEHDEDLLLGGMAVLRRAQLAWCDLDMPEPARLRADRPGLAGLPGEPATREDEEDLLLAAVLVRGRRPASRRKLDPPYPDADAACSLAEERPRAGQVADLALAPARLVPMRDAHQR